MIASSNIVSKVLRYFALVFASLLALYALIGYVIAPIAAKHFALKAIHEHTHWTPVIESIEFDPFDLKLDIQQLLLLGPEQNTGERNKEISFSSLSIDLKAQRLIAGALGGNLDIAVDNVILISPFIDLTLDKSGELLIGKRLKPSDTPEENVKTENEDTSKAVVWQVDQIKIMGGATTIKDYQPNTPFTLSITELDLALAELSNDLSRPISYDLALLANKAPLSLRGNVAPDPLTLNADFTLSELNLELIQPYLTEQTTLLIEKGALDLEGTVSLESHNELSTLVSVASTMKNLAIMDTSTEVRPISFDTFSLSSTSVKYPELDISVGPIELTNPTIGLVRTEQGEIAFGAKDQSNPESTEEESEVSDATSDQEPRSVSFKLAAVALEGGSVLITDQSLKPAFSNKLTDISLSIDQFDGENPTALGLKMGMFEDGKLDVKGTVTPIDKGATNLAIALKNLSLPKVSGYSQHFTGFPIDDGRLNLDLKYEITEQQLDASHKILVDHLEFGDKDGGNSIVSAPLPMLVAMLENNSQLINLDIPVGGDLSDPTVNVFSLVIDGLQAFFTKLITSPFSMLGKLIGIEGDFAWVAFEAGQAELSAEQSYRLQQIARLMTERPKLALTIKPTYSFAQDSEALKTQTGLSEIKEEQLLSLASRRADYLRRFLVEQSGVTENRISLETPAAATKDHQAIRTEFEISSL